MKKKNRIPMKVFKGAAVAAIAGTALGAAALYNGGPRWGDYPVSGLLPSETCAREISEHFNARAVENMSARTASPAILIPGFALDDDHLHGLQETLRRHGYDARGWGAGRNMGPDAIQIERFLQTVKDTYEQSGQQPVFLIGYSAGGVHAREVARIYPHMVRGVVTIASPFAMTNDNGTPDARVSQIRSIYTDLAQNAHAQGTAPSVPMTSVFSFNDIVVNWRASLEPASAHAENIPLGGGHLSLPFQADVAQLILDRMAQDKLTWQPLQKKICPRA